MSERLKAVAAGQRAAAQAIRLALTLCAALTTTAAPAATLFTGAKIHPVSSAPIDNGQLLIDGDRIVAVGADLSAQAAGADPCRG